MQNLECSQRYIFILVCVSAHTSCLGSQFCRFAMMRWWQERAVECVHVQLSPNSDVTTAGQLDKHFFWQFLKHEAPADDNYDNEKELVALDRESAKAASGPINMRYLVRVYALST